MDVKRVSDRLVGIKVKGGQEMIMKISSYGPEVGCAEREKVAFLDDLEDMVGEVK